METIPARHLIDLYGNIICCMFDANEIEKENSQADVKARSRDIVEALSKFGLPFTRKTADRLADAVNASQWAHLERIVEEMERRFLDETDGLQFIQLAPSSLELLASARLGFGEAVGRAFPSACFDVSECITCFSLGRFTASVMHAMRALEPPLKGLCAALKAKPSEKGWGPDLSILANQWNKIEQSPKKPSNWRNDRQFYHEVFAEFSHFQFAWRNHVMHATANYNQEASQKIIYHTRSFMEKLASKVCESGLIKKVRT